MVRWTVNRPACPDEQPAKSRTVSGQRRADLVGSGGGGANRRSSAARGGSRDQPDASRLEVVRRQVAPVGVHRAGLDVYPVDLLRHLLEPGVGEQLEPP